MSRLLRRVGPANRRVRAALLCSTLLATTTPIAAQDSEISEDRDTAVDTLTELGVSPATLSLAEGVTISAPSGPVITINGPHSLNLLGTVRSLDSTSGVGVFADTDFGLTSDIVLDGSIVLNGPEDFELDMTLETTNAGILIDGSGTFDGDLTLSDGSNISVWGAGSTGVLINSPFLGDILVDGSINVQGNRAIGLLINDAVTGDVTVSGTVLSTNPDGTAIAVRGPINGAFVFSGSMQAGEGATFDDDGEVVDAIPGVAALQVTDSITGGILFQGVGVEFTDDGDGDDDTTLRDSSVTTLGGTPVIRVENEQAGSDLTIGRVDSSSYGVLLRGNMTVNGSSAGIPSTGMIFRGLSAGARTLIEGGIHFDTGILDVSAVDADVNAITIGDFAEVPEIYNRGTILAEATVSTGTDDDGNATFGPGGNAVGILIEENGSLQTLINEENILVASGGGASSSTAVLDLSGTLSTIRNEGEWRAIITNPADETVTGSAVAIDVRANTSGIALFNSGGIVGDILLGEGSDNVEFVDGTLDGSIDFGAGTNVFSLTGTSEFTGSISHSGTLDLLVTGADLELGLDQTLNVTTASFTDASTISVFVDAEQSTQGTFQATSTVFIAGDTLIDPDLESFVFSETTFTFLNAGDLTIDTDDLSGLLTETPFLYHTSLALSETDQNSLDLIVSPKTSEELGLAGNASTLYEHFLSTALNPNDSIENALTGLTTQEQTDAAFTSMLGDASSASMDLALIVGNLQQTRQLDSLASFASGERPETNFWARQNATYGNGTSSSDDRWDTDILSVGVEIGADLSAGDNFVWGVNGGFLLSGIDRDSGIGDELSIFTPYIGAYTMLKAGKLFAGFSGSAAFHDIDRERTVAIGNASLLAESATNGYQLQGSLLAGYNLEFGKFSLRPTAGLNATYYHESGYTEEGAASASLRVGSRSLTRVDATVGASAGFDINWSEGTNPTIVRPEVFAEYSKAISGENPGTVNFGFSATGETAEFDLDRLGDTGKAGGVALRIIKLGGDAVVRYTYRDRDFVTMHEASLNFRLQF